VRISGEGLPWRYIHVGWIDLPPHRGFAFLACAQRWCPSDRRSVPCVPPVAERDQRAEVVDRHWYLPFANKVVSVGGPLVRGRMKQLHHALTILECDRLWAALQGVQRLFMQIQEMNLFQHLRRGAGPFSRCL